MSIDLYAIRSREVQAIGAAISNRDWHGVEQAYNSLRDKLDRAGFTVAGPPSPSPATLASELNKDRTGNHGTEVA